MQEVVGCLALREVPKLGVLFLSSLDKDYCFRGYTLSPVLNLETSCLAFLLTVIITMTVATVSMVDAIAVAPEEAMAGVVTIERQQITQQGRRRRWRFDEELKLPPLKELLPCTQCHQPRTCNTNELHP